ncbi:MAG TPA: hypothetical protein VMB72_04255 [Acidimicrobiales bacterium]|nr:hypothetical protein [Acidimicrobiales bacterium]
MRAGWARAAARCGAVGLAVVLGACGGTGAPGPRTTGTAALPPAPPLASTAVTADAALVVVPMGDLGQALNTFWELFVRPTGAATWTLVTPPGVADNGGLVVSPAVTGGSLLAGFEPSQDLEYSPLARSTDQGATWSPGLVPGGLAPTPDAVATTGSVSVALLRRGGGAVVHAGEDGTWSTLVDRAALGRTAAGRRCGVAALGAVALGPDGTVFVGAACRHHVTGVFAGVGGTWQLVAPPPGGDGATRVVRLVDAGASIEALVDAPERASPRLVAVAVGGAGRVAVSPPLALPPHSRLVATGTGAGGGFVVLSAAPGRGDAVEVEEGGAGSWERLPAPPPGTAAVAQGPGGTVDALVVASTRYSDWRLDPRTGTWSRMGTVTVPIAFGSSS